MKIIGWKKSRNSSGFLRGAIYVRRCDARNFEANLVGDINISSYHPIKRHTNSKEALIYLKENIKDEIRYLESKINVIEKHLKHKK